MMKIQPITLIHNIKIWLKKWRIYLLLAITLPLLALVIIDQSISYSVRNQIYNDIEKTPYRPYALLLGTSKFVSKNTPNLYYDYRLESAIALFNAHKIRYILLSGDNRTPQYNEPKMMAKDLRQMGIDEQYLYRDYAGFRTLDSIIRSKEVFQIEPMMIITQRFHCERALFIANYHHIDAICFAAEEPYAFSLTRVRETLARVLMLWELLIEKAPHFLGNPEPLPRLP